MVASSLFFYKTYDSHVNDKKQLINSLVHMLLIWVASLGECQRALLMPLRVLGCDAEGFWGSEIIYTPSIMLLKDHQTRLLEVVSLVCWPWRP
jgi:hypothetical protein